MRLMTSSLDVYSWDIIANFHNFGILGSLASTYKTSLACKWTNVWLLFSLQFSSPQMIGIEVFGQPSAGVCVIAAFICDDSDFSSCRCEYCGPGWQYSGTEEVESGPSFEVMIIQYHILQIMNSRSGATSKPRAKFQGGCYLEDIPREAGARRGALWSPAYADPSSYHSPALLREDNLFSVLNSLSPNNVF